MRKHFRLLLISAALLVSLPVAADQAAPQPDFQDLILQIHRLNEYSPLESRALVEEARSWLQRAGTPEQEIELVAASAPLMAMQRGYGAALESLGVQLQAAENSPHRQELVPLVLTAISSLARRNGDIEYAMDNLERVYRYLPRQDRSLVPDGIIYSLLHETVQVLYGAPELYPSISILDLLASMGGDDDPLWRDRILMSRARIASLNRDYDQLHEILDKFAAGIDANTEPLMVKVFWIMKAYEVLNQGSVEMARSYLQTADNIWGPGVDMAKQGSVLLTEALVALRTGAPMKRVEQLIDEARQAYYNTGDPADFCIILGQVARPMLTEESEDLPSELIRPLVFDCAVEGNLFLRSDVALSKAFHLRLSGRPEEAMEQLFRSRELVVEATMRVGKLELAVQNATPWILLQPGTESGQPLDFHILLILLLLVVMVLLLLLRVRTQQMINQSLRESVQKSRLAEREAEQASQLKSQFLSNVSHELKTPMSGLVGMASILDELVSDPLQRKYLKTIRDCSQNMMVLVNDLLDLGRMESGRLEIEHRPFKLRETLNYCSGVVAQSAADKGIVLETNFEASLPQRLIGDSTRLGQVLINLLSNAIKFTAQGSVELRAGYVRSKRRDGMLVVSISDTGPGIEPHKLDVLFEPFLRGQDKQSGQEGSGLGLAISHKLVELMGGSIEVSSKVGKGSVFSVRLPFPSADDDLDNADE